MNHPSPNPSADNPVDPEKLFEDVFMLHQNGRYQEAESLYRRLIRIFPEIWQLHFNLGLLLYELERLDEALQTYLQAQAHTDSSSDLFYNTGICQKRLGLYEAAAASYNSALFLDPDDIDCLYNLGGCYLADDKDQEATEVYEKLLRSHPEHLSALNNLAYLYHKTGKTEQAAARYARILELAPNHVSADHMLAALTGRSRPGAPDSYIREMFDNFSDHYEKSLMETLKYQLPATLLNFVCQHSAKLQFSSVLDLGCGTGLAGMLFKPWSEKLTGVDISEKMAVIARSKGIYQHLHVDEIKTFLRGAQPGSYDLAVAADVLPYFGELDALFEAVHHAVAPEAMFFFSVEDDETVEPDQRPRLRQSGRFAHCGSYLAKVAERTGWLIVATRHLELRRERDGWIDGCIYALRKAALT